VRQVRQKCAETLKSAPSKAKVRQVRRKCAETLKSAPSKAKVRRNTKKCTMRREKFKKVRQEKNKPK